MRIKKTVLIILLLLSSLYLQAWSKKEIKNLHESKNHSALLNTSLNLLKNDTSLTTADKSFLVYYTALAYKESRNKSMALKYFKELYLNYPFSEYCKSALTEEIELIKDDFIKRDAAISNFIEKYPKTEGAEKIILKYVPEQIKEKNYKSALKNLEILINLWKRGDAYPDTYMLLAIAYSGIKDYIEAIDYLRIVENKNKNLIFKNRDYLFETGVIFFNNQNFKKAIKYLERFINIYSKDLRISRASLLLASAYERTKNPLMACIHLSSVLKHKKKKDYAAMLNLARLTLTLPTKDQKKINPSFSNPEKLLKIVKQNSKDSNIIKEATLILSEYYKKTGREEDLIQNYLSYLKRQRDSYVEKQFRNNLNSFINNLYQNKEFEKILKFWAELKYRKSYFSADNLLKIADILYKMKLFKNCREIYDHILKYRMYKKYWPDAYAGIIEVLYSRGESAELEKYINKIKNKALNSKLKYYYYRSLKDQNKLREAKKITDALKPPFSDNVFTAELLIEKINISLKKRDNSKALSLLTHLDKMKNIRELKPELLCIRADINFCMKNLSRALDLYRESEKGKFNLEWVYFQIMRINHMLSDTKNYNLYKDKLKKLKPDSFWLKQWGKNV